MYFYDLDVEEMINVLNESPYRPYSDEKKNRKLTTLVNYLNGNGYKVDRCDISVRPERGFFGTEYWVQIFNPHPDLENDDTIYFSFKWFTL